MAVHVASDAIIAASYYSIPIALLTLVIKRRDLQFGWMFWMFAAFILACGSTHLLEIWTLWHPDYATQGVVKAATAGVSLVTAVMMWPLIPRALLLPSPSQLQAANDKLMARVAERDAAVVALERETAERLAAESRFREAQKMEAIGQLTGGIAHDFNNLLTVIIGNLEALERRTGDHEGISRLVEGALQGATRGAALTQQLLAFARRQPLRTEAVPMDCLLIGMMDLLRGTVGETISVNVEIAEGCWPVEADWNQIESAILNLAINARHAMPAGGDITIHVANRPVGGQATADAGAPEPADYVAIAVSDTGTGMTEAVQARAFEPFFTTREVGQGSGLGLSQVQGFAQQSRGYVTLDSTPGAGTTVTLFLRRATIAER